MSSELGRAIREARQRQRYSQARLSKIVGISRRQLAAIESGANTSTRVVELIATALHLEEVPLGSLTARVPQPFPVHPRVLIDRTVEAERSVREAAAALHHVWSTLQSFERLSGGDSIADHPLAEPQPGTVTMPLLAEIAPGGSLTYMEKLELVAVESMRVDDGEALIRIRGKKAAREGLSEGDILVVEFRPAGNAATGEVVIALADEEAVIGRWWNKRGRRALRGLRTDRVVREIRRGEPVMIVASVTDIVRRARR